MNHIDSALLIPLAAFVVAIVAIISGVIGNALQKKIKADQRMLMVQRGMPVADIERLLGGKDEPDIPRDPLRRLRNTRTTALVLIFTGVGALLFFVILSVVVREHDVLAGAAVSIVPLFIGFGFAVDYGMQAREIARLGLDLPGVHANRVP